MPEIGSPPPSRSPSGVRALTWEGGSLVVLDQRQLPGATVHRTLGHLSEVAEAIRTLTVRGAPTIGVAAAYGMVLGQRVDGLGVDEAAKLLRETRPTAHDLFVGIAEVERAWRSGHDTLRAAAEYERRVVEECHAIGEVGAPLVGLRARVLTHCNAGALATVAWGTALAPIRVAFRSGRDPFVWVDETRPLLQGSRLTAWELQHEGIRHAVIADNAAGYFFGRGEVDLVIVGADRITRSGDFANKVGTYEKAVLARENGVPFYVAAPWSTFDVSLTRADEIPVEERSGEEVRRFAGTATVPEGSPVRNPAFDLTPHRFVRGFITPDGVLAPEEIEGHLKARRRLLP